MKTYRPKSWNKQARMMADNQYWYYYNAINNSFPESITDEKWKKEMAEIDTYRHFFANSYRPPIIRYRAAKRFRRLRRANKKPLYI